MRIEAVLTLYTSLSDVRARIESRKYKLKSVKGKNTVSHSHENVVLGTRST